MSLLMDALRKAEAAKQRAGETAPPEGAAPVAPAAMPASPARSRLPDLSLHSDAVDAELAAVSNQSSPRRPAAAAPYASPAEARTGEANERSAARNVFAAKQPARSHSALWLIVGLGALAALGLGAYYGWQLQAVSGGSALRPLPTMPAAAQASLPSAPPPAAIPSSAAPKPAPAVQPLAQGALPPAAPEAANPAQPIAALEPRPAVTRKPAAAAPDNVLRVARSQPQPNRTLDAYENLQAGRLDEAQRGYELVLRSDAKNTDALLGLATIAVQRGEIDTAQAFYLSALEADPNDATAQAGLINMRGFGDPDAAESRLKTALSSQPDSAVLYFALGNVYARQQRWNEAQQAYFRAYASEPDNADIIFNLAVSLDHLHQDKLAAQFYQRALAAAGKRHAAFDRAQVKARLLDLQP